MENIAVLGGVVINFMFKYGSLLICIIGILRLYVLRKGKKKHYTTLIITTIFALLTIYFWVGEYLSEQEIMKEISGDFKLMSYKCEKCPECIVKLISNGTYVLLKNGQEIDEGKWDYSMNLMTIFLNIENGSSNEIFKENRTLSYMKNDNCQEYWRNENLNATFEGVILQIDSTNTTYGMYSILLKDERTQRELNYEPKYISHPWLNDKIQIGDSIKKERNRMGFTIRKLDGEILEIKE